ncbi:unnamed protein product [Toxocara canis]|uniref:Uncharacterized protein n=1 Tax=Toxocara canis TaxID=6265 RepID=A0A183U5S6_TOXCA|nr:unnamed protein product [Toxocara canis]
MDAVEPFSIRYLPDIRWQGMTRNDTYIILMVDAGFGMLNYLAYDYPRNAKVKFGCILLAWGTRCWYET